MTLKELTSEFTINEAWHDAYIKYVPLFIENAKKCNNYTDWDKEVFEEFFEKVSDHCVSSLRQGYFNKKEKAKIKEHWLELAPKLKAIAESQEVPLWNVYNDIYSIIRKYTKRNMLAASNRIIASLQPNLISTTVSTNDLKKTFELMHEFNLPDVPEYDSSNWALSSHRLMEYFKKHLNCTDCYTICTLPWELKIYLENKKSNTGSMTNNLQKYIDLLKANKNLILTGAPGTGKTYLANLIAKEMHAETEFVQFHPSYDYTDFVEGLRPEKDANGTLGFARRNGVFKDFCAKAQRNIEDSKKEVSELKVEQDFKNKYDNFIEKINEGQITEINQKTGKSLIIYEISSQNNIIIKANQDSKVTHTVSCSRLYKLSQKYPDIDSLDSIKNISKSIKSVIGGCNESAYWGVLKAIYEQNYNPSESEDIAKVSEKDYVFIIDEINRGEISKIFGELFFLIDPGYREEDKTVKMNTQYQNLVDPDDIFAHGFFIPENVYIIGTMNDIDRSVESMDFAMRRRFAWVEIKPDDRKEMWDGKLKGTIRDSADKVMNALNEEISKTRGLGPAYQIGPSYFLKLESYQGDFNKLWNLHIEVILKEYLRGFNNAKDKLEEFKSCYFNSLK